MLESIFREYDIRGKVGDELDLGRICDLGLAIATYYLTHAGSPLTLAVARDGRVHSQGIQRELINALLKCGINVVDLGLCSTPVMYFALHTSRLDGGLIVTASHNGKEYNGIKLCLGKESLWGKQIQEIKDIFYQKKVIKTGQKGSYLYRPKNDQYVAYLTKEFASLKNFKIPIVVDCASGATGPILQGIKKSLELNNVELLYDMVDGNFPAHDPDPVTPKNMVALHAKVLNSKAHFGIGLDGDGDRMSAMLHSGQLILGDKLGALFVQDILKENQGAKVIFDVKCSGLVDVVVRQSNGSPLRSPSGHSIIKYQMKNCDAIFGGEYSCHFFFKDRYFGYDDGIYACLRLCDLLQRSGKSLDALINELPQYVSSPEIRIACATEIRAKIMERTYAHFAVCEDATLSTIDGVLATLPYGWGIVRPSNTQPEVCLRFESQTQEGLERIKRVFYGLLEGYVDKALLKSSFEI